jgi:hypothetical protein
MEALRLFHATPTFAAGAAATATAFAVAGALIVAGAGPTPVGRILAVLMGFLVLGAGAVLVLALAAPDERWQGRSGARPG